ncbi:MAG: NnrU family protein [Pseudomonadota bacterium]|nr:NnrU family protein [Pseudomonadota bacterium]
MAILLVGLVLFLGAHLLPTFPEPRARLRGRLGEGPYRGLFSLVSLVGFALIVWGYSRAPFVGVWTPPVWTRHLALLLMIPAMILLVATYAPPGRIKAAVRHPMLAAVKIWAFAHLLANGDLASILLFGAFLAYAVYDRISVKHREARGEVTVRGGPARNDVYAVLGGLALYAVFAVWLHPLLIGVPALPV